LDTAVDVILVIMYQYLRDQIIPTI